MAISDEKNRVEEQMNEKKEAAIIAQKLRTPLDSHGNPDAGKKFLQGGYLQEGYGVAEGAAIDGSHAFEGNQGYYAAQGKEVFLSTVQGMKDLFRRREKKLGEPVRYVIKPGIGGQHTPFQAIASLFSMIEKTTGTVIGEYELGKDFDASMTQVLNENRFDWDKVAVIPSSKSGSTDETMMIFTEIFYILLKYAAAREGLEGEAFADIVLETLHDVNFVNGKERPAKDLFKVDPERFKTESLIALVNSNAKARGLAISAGQVKGIFGRVLGNMFFETTDRVEQSRLSAFIRNSGLDRELGDDSPGFGAMFDNVGGRWTGDLHMMTFLAFHDLDAGEYWEVRRKGVQAVRDGTHAGNLLGNKILDERITDIALLLPDELFWFGKAIEQNFNESVWQTGFSNLIAVVESQWEAQKKYYEDRQDTARKNLVINLSRIELPTETFNVVDHPVSRTRLSKQELANAFGDLFTVFYGMTNTVGNRLIARALKEAGLKAGAVDLNDTGNRATKIVQANLFLRQPYVELGKGLLEARLKALQESQSVRQEFEKVLKLALERQLVSNMKNILFEADGQNRIALAVREARKTAQVSGRKFVPFIYLEGEKFHEIRNFLTRLGVEWVMQGTGDQHISYQQVLARPERYLPFLVSFVPQNPLPGRPAIGFAKGYLDGASPHLVRDLFAEASYRALTELRGKEGGMGIFLRLVNSDVERNLLKKAFQ